MNLLNEYRVGDIVKPKTGVHKGEDHKIIGIHENGRISVKPHMMPRDRVKYRLGAALAHYSELEPVIKESIDRQEVRVDQRRNATVVINGKRATHAVKVDRRKPLRAKPAVKKVRDADDLQQQAPLKPMPLPVSDLTQIKLRR